MGNKPVRPEGPQQAGDDTHGSLARASDSSLQAGRSRANGAGRRAGRGPSTQGRFDGVAGLTSGTSKGDDGSGSDEDSNGGGGNVGGFILPEGFVVEYVDDGDAVLEGVVVAEEPEDWGSGSGNEVGFLEDGAVVDELPQRAVTGAKLRAAGAMAAAPVPPPLEEVEQPSDEDDNAGGGDSSDSSLSSGALSHARWLEQQRKEDVRAGRKPEEFIPSLRDKKKKMAADDEDARRMAYLSGGIDAVSPPPRDVRGGKRRDLDTSSHRASRPPFGDSHSVLGNLPGSPVHLDTVLDAAGISGDGGGGKGKAKGKGKGKGKEKEKGKGQGVGSHSGSGSSSDPAARRRERQRAKERRLKQQQRQKQRTRDISIHGFDTRSPDRARVPTSSTPDAVHDPEEQPDGYVWSPEHEAAPEVPSAHSEDASDSGPGSGQSDDDEEQKAPSRRRGHKQYRARGTGPGRHGQSGQMGRALPGGKRGDSGAPSKVSGGSKSAGRRGAAAGGGGGGSGSWSETGSESELEVGELRRAQGDLGSLDSRIVAKTPAELARELKEQEAKERAELERPKSNEELGLPEGLATIISYHDAPYWHHHSTFAVQESHGPAFLRGSQMYLVDPKFSSIGLWTGMCTTPTCFPLPNRTVPRPCFIGPGTDSQDALLDGRLERKQEIARKLRVNNNAATKARADKAAIESGKSDEYWYYLRMHQKNQFEAVMEQRAKLNGLLEFLDTEREELNLEDKANDFDLDALATRRGLRSAFQVDDPDTAVITGIAVDWTGTVWVTDYGNLTIKGYHQTGVLMREIEKGYPPLWSHPYAVAVNHTEKSVGITSCPPKGHPEYGQGVVTKFTFKGELLGTSSRTLPIREPTSIAFDEENVLCFIGDSAYQKVWVLHGTGLYVVRTVESDVNITKQFSGICSLCYTPDTRQLHVLDRSRLEVYNVAVRLEKGKPVMEKTLEASLDHPGGSTGRAVVVHCGDPSTRRKIIILQ